MVMWKGGSIMNLPELTHEEEVNLERFANLMIELIEKHADAVDKDEMLKKLNKIKETACQKKVSYGTASGKVGSHAKQGEGDKTSVSFYVYQKTTIIIGKNEKMCFMV